MNDEGETGKRERRKKQNERFDRIERIERSDRFDGRGKSKDEGQKGVASSPVGRFEA